MQPEEWGKGPVFGLIAEFHNECRLIVGEEVNALASSLKNDATDPVKADDDGPPAKQPRTAHPFFTPRDLPHRVVDSIHSLKRYGVSLSATQWLHKRTAAAAASVALITQTPVDFEALERGEVTSHTLFAIPEVAVQAPETLAGHKLILLSPNERALDRTVGWFVEWVESLGRPLQLLFEETAEGRRRVAEVVQGLGGGVGGVDPFREWMDERIGVGFDPVGEGVMLNLCMVPDGGGWEERGETVALRCCDGLGDGPVACGDWGITLDVNRYAPDEPEVLPKRRGRPPKHTPPPPPKKVPTTFTPPPLFQSLFLTLPVTPKKPVDVPPAAAAADHDDDTLFCPMTSKLYERM
ncbi:hypothetical protein HDU67_004676, partial [Dinochytrium kinnereticum]